ncbi:MAG: M14 family zinc carboxypeptidase [Christensenellales bacterium]|jgi:murein tripeptide amidase MpaA
MIYGDLFHKASAAAKRVVIGRSVQGRAIYAFVKGRDKSRKILIHGGIHARECITARLVYQMIIDYNSDAEIWFVPLVNPDGAELVVNGLESANIFRRKRLVKLNGGKKDFSLWKANIKGVDLNVNFDALWGTGINNIRYRHSENYIGKKPFSEPETRALRRVTKANDFVLTISYHTKGKEIYWGFNNDFRYYDEAVKFSALTGYPLLKSTGSAGGYKDWFVKTFERLGLTIETGDDSYPHPIPEDAFDEIYKENADVPRLAAEVAKSLKKIYLNCLK